MGGKVSKTLKKVKSKKNLKNGSSSAAAVPAADGGAVEAGNTDVAVAGGNADAVPAGGEITTDGAKKEQAVAPTASDNKPADSTPAAAAVSAGPAAAGDTPPTNPAMDAANKATADAYTAAAGTQDHGQASDAAVAAAETSATATAAATASSHVDDGHGTLPVSSEVKAQDEHGNTTTTAQTDAQATDALTAHPPASAVPTTTTTATTDTPRKKPVIYVIMYSTWGHTKTLADAIVRGVEDAGGEATLWRVPETLDKEVLEKMHASPDANNGVPVIATEDLVKADGFLFGLPTRYGTAPAQIKTFWDATGKLWQQRSLIGKYGGLFHTTATQHGGQETTSLTFLAHYVHHGILYVPLGYTNPILNDNSEVIGGSPYGAGTIAGGDGSRQPSAKELEVAQWQGKQFTKVLAKAV